MLHTAQVQQLPLAGGEDEGLAAAEAGQREIGQGVTGH